MSGLPYGPFLRVGVIGTSSFSLCPSFLPWDLSLGMRFGSKIMIVPRNTILAIGQHASPMLISLAIGNIVFVDLLRLLKHGRDVILMLSDLVIDAVRKHKARKATLVSEQRERDQDWNTALEAAGITPEQKARIGEALARKHDGKEEKPA